MPAVIGARCYLLGGDPEFVIECLEEKRFQRILRQIVERNTAQAAKHVERLVGGNDEIPKRGGSGVGRVHASGNGRCGRNFRPERPERPKRTMFSISRAKPDHDTPK